MQMPQERMASERERLALTQGHIHRRGDLRLG
jgi:hypothetical protein